MDGSKQFLELAGNIKPAKTLRYFLLMVKGFRISSPSLILVLMLVAGCRADHRDPIFHAGREPCIHPDYSGVVIPPNIAPMNFAIMEPQDHFRITVISSDGFRTAIRSSDGKVIFTRKDWKKLVSRNHGGHIEITVSGAGKNGKSVGYAPLFMYVANEPVDPFLCYRILFPGYETWGEMNIVQRSTGDFKETSLIENRLIDNNCVNCHTFKRNNPDTFFLHVRGSRAGTYFSEGGNIRRMELKTDEMPGNAVYPAWHPSGRFLAFSSNRIYSIIHMFPGKNVEMYDRASILTFYDIDGNTMSIIPEKDSVEFMETFPAWSPDGNYLYYCRTGQVQPVFDYRKVYYDLVRKPFNPETLEFGDAEIVFSAGDISKSASSPSVSPDNKYIVFTLHNYGSFSSWHREADLYLLDLRNGNVERMDLNSDEAESYHSWSSNGRWLVFSSKRDDGFHARLYLAYFGNEGHTGKPFILPRKDPAKHKSFMKSYNRPVFIQGKPGTGPRDFMRASGREPLAARWMNEWPPEHERD